MNPYGPEVLVIGGGPAGLAAAIAAAQAGLSVELAEPLPGPIDKCCGEGLLPAAVAALRLLGISAAQLEEHGSPIAGISFRRGGLCACAPFQAPAFGLRRTSLVGLLLRRALEAGVCIVRAGARLQAEGGGFRVDLADGQQRRPQWIVGADGAGSATRAGAGLGAGREISCRYAIRQHFRLPFGRRMPENVEVHWAAGSQAYVTPIGSGRVGVAVLSSGRQGNMESALAPFPSLAAWLHHAAPCSRLRGAITAHRTLRNVCRGPVVLVGDAAGSVDAVTGDGLSLAFAQAVALGQALRSGDLQGYGTAHARLGRIPWATSRVLVAMGAHPMVTRPCVGLLASMPGLFRGLLALHTRVPRLLACAEVGRPTDATCPALVEK